MTEKTIQFGNASLRICGRGGDPYFDALNLADHTNDFFAMALSLLPANAVVFDVGANIGLTAVMAAQKASKVYCFEPSPAAFSHLVSTISANDLDGRVEAVNYALGAETGDFSFLEDAASESASHIITDATLARKSDVHVAVRTLDSFVAERSIQRLDLIKVDVEGFEVDVLYGGAETISALRPSAIVEFNSFTMIGFRDINPRYLLDLLRKTFPYVYYWRDGPVLIDTDSDALTFLHQNLVSAGCVDDLYCSFSFDKK